MSLRIFATAGKRTQFLLRTYVHQRPEKLRPNCPITVGKPAQLVHPP